MNALDRDAGPAWLLLIHQIPPKPDYLRVKIGRRLQRVGAVAVKNSVYALPDRAEALEDFQWVRSEIVDGGGDASICRVRLRKRFDAVREIDFFDAPGRAMAEDALGSSSIALRAPG